MMILLTAGVAKSLDLSDFNTQVGTWTVFPLWTHKLAVVLVPVIEIVLPGIWFLGFIRHQIACFALVFLITITTAYLLQSTLGNPPKCNCLGRLASYWKQMESIRWHIAFNLTLLLALGIGLALMPRNTRHPRHRRLVLHQSRAFTFVEMLAAMLILAVLLAITIPTVFSVRRQASDALVSALLKQHTIIFSHYTMDYRDAWPIAVADGKWSSRGTTSLSFGPFGMQEVSYFSLHAMWPALLAPVYYENNYLHPSFAVPGWPVSPITPFHYSSVFLADPKFWNYEHREGPSQWRGTYSHEVLFPSAKSLLIDWVYLSRSENLVGDGQPVMRRVAISLVDGSSRIVRELDVLPGYRSGEGNWPGSTNSFARPAMHTLDGVRGRDLP